ANSTITMNPVATSDAAFRGGACPTPEYTIAYTGNYTTSADANSDRGPGALTLTTLVRHLTESLHDCPLPGDNRRMQAGTG
ncbi:hypothetical protein, partial [Parapedomonas caeni]